MHLVVVYFGRIELNTTFLMPGCPNRAVLPPLRPSPERRGFTRLVSGFTRFKVYELGG